MTASYRALLIRMGPYDMTQAIPRAAATLREMNCSVTILSLDTTRQKPSEEKVNDWRILWYHHAYKSGNKLSFLWAWLCWWIWVIRHILRNHYHLIQASNLESIVPCVLVKPFRKFKLVFDVRDPWGMNSADSGSLLMRTFKTMERRAAARVDGMVLSQGILDRTGIYFGEKVCNRIPAVQVLNVPGQDMAGRYIPPDTRGIRINFSGHISYIRNAQAIIDLAAQNPQVMVDVIGDIRDEKLHSALSTLSNIKLYGRLPFKQAMELLQQANIICVMYNTNTEVAVVSSANKMFEAMMMSRPYIASKNGFPGIIAEKYNLGWAIPYGDSDVLMEKINYLISNPAEIESKAQKGRKIYEEYFTWDKQKANLKLLYTYLIDGKDVQFISFAGWKKIMGVVLS